MMAFPIRYSYRASVEYEEILDYILLNFGEGVCQKVDNYLQNVILQISINPMQFPMSNVRMNLHRCVASSQTSIYYLFVNEYVEIVSFRSNRKDPDDNLISENE